MRTVGLFAIGIVACVATVAWAGNNNNNQGGQDCDHQDNCGYPKQVPKNGNAKLGVAFTENDAINTAGLVANVTGNPNEGNFAAWYNEEFSLILGVGELDTIAHFGSPVVKTYPTSPVATLVAPGPSYAGSTTITWPNPALGFLNSTGNDAAGRPAYPAIFLTDITTNGTLTTGDWQNGGDPVVPNAVFGTWKSAVNTSTTTPASVSLAGVADPHKNLWALGTGADITTPLGTYPAGFGADEGWSSEVVWNLSGLVDKNGAPVTLTPGDKYRVQVIMHQGDTGSNSNWWNFLGNWGKQGDVIEAGEFCTTFTAPQTTNFCAQQPALSSTNGGTNWHVVTLTGSGITIDSCSCPGSGTLFTTPVPLSFFGSASAVSGIPAGSYYSCTGGDI